MHERKTLKFTFYIFRHYTEPLIPNIPGIEEFNGETFHSHSYRTADRYKGKRVLVLGARASGIDLAIEIASVADKVC